MLKSGLSATRLAATDQRLRFEATAWGPSSPVGIRGPSHWKGRRAASLPGSRKSQDKGVSGSTVMGEPLISWSGTEVVCSGWEPWPWGTGSASGSRGVARREGLMHSSRRCLGGMELMYRRVGPHAVQGTTWVATCLPAAHSPSSRWQPPSNLSEPVLLSVSCIAG